VQWDDWIKSKIEKFTQMILITEKSRSISRVKDVIFQRDRIIKVSLAKRSKRNVVYRMLIQLSGRSGRYSVCLLRLLFGMP